MIILCVLYVGSIRKTIKKIESLDNTIEDAIHSAIRHLQRSYSDICEWGYMNVKDSINNILKDYSPEQIQAAIPNYYSEIKPRLEKINKELIQYKENKSSENNDLTDDSANITMFSSQINELSKFLTQVKNAEVSLVEIKKKQKSSKVLAQFILPICTGVIGALIVYFITL